jgi:VanZ family protein
VDSRTLARALRAGWPALAWAGLIFLVSHQSRPLPIAPPFDHADKVVHALVFGLLSALAARALLAAGQPGRRALWIAVAAASLYGAADEWHQSFVPGRDSDPRDWAADTAGAIAGAALVAGLPRRKSRASIRG